MNLEARLTEALNDVLRSSGYIFETMNNNKKQSNLITGPNNQVIPPVIINQISASIAEFDRILDETVGKFNDAKWCVGQIVENKQKQEELRLQEEMERQKRAEEQKRREEEERIQRQQEEERRAEEEKRREQERIEREKLEEEARRQQEEAEAREKKEREEREERERIEREEQERLRKQEEAEAAQKEKNGDQDFDLMGPTFDLDMDMDKLALGMTNPGDILYSLDYKEDGKPDENKPVDNDLDLNNILGNGQGFDDLNMDLLGQEFDGSHGNADEEFDVDNFLNQFGNA